MHQFLCVREDVKESEANTLKVKYLKGDYLGWAIDDKEICM